MEARPELPLPLATEEDWAAVRELSAHCRWYPHDVVVMMPNCVRRIVALYLFKEWTILINPYLLGRSGDPIPDIPVKCSAYPDKLCLMSRVYPDIDVSFNIHGRGTTVYEAKVFWGQYILKSTPPVFQVSRASTPECLIYRLQYAISILDGWEPTLVSKDFRTRKLNNDYVGRSFLEG